MMGFFYKHMNMDKTNKQYIELLVAGLFMILVAAATYHLVAPSIYFGDHPELATVAYSLGVPHGPGYPSYTLSSHLLIALLPLDPVRVANLFSWLCGALSAGLAVLTVLLLTRRLIEFRVIRQIIALTIGLCQMVNLELLSQSAASEVNALNYMLIWLVFWIIARYLMETEMKWAFLWALVTGISGGNHFLAGLVAPGLLVVILTARKGMWRQLPIMCLFFLLGLSVYLFLPLRSHAGAVIDWGHPATLENFTWTITNQGFMEGKFEFPFEQVLRAIGLFGELLLDRLGAILITFAFLGITLGWSIKALRSFWLALVISFMLLFVFVINNIAPAFEWPVLSMPNYIVVLLFGAIGMVIAFKWISSIKKPIHIILILVIASTTVLLPVLRASSVTYLYDKSQSYAAQKLTRAALASLAPNAVVIIMPSSDYFAMENQLVVYGTRPDVDAAFGMLIEFDWARKQLAERAKGFRTPSHFGYHALLDYFLIKQDKRPLYYQSVDDMDRFLPLHMAPWGMLYRVEPYISLQIEDYQTTHEKLITRADDILSEDQDVFTPAIGLGNAEGRLLYYEFLGEVGRLALSYLDATPDQKPILEKQFAQQDPPAVLELLRSIKSKEQLKQWLAFIKQNTIIESDRVQYFKSLIIEQGS
jgi:hypothetical protein